jgi:hypothetical protein
MLTEASVQYTTDAKEAEEIGFTKFDVEVYYCFSFTGVQALYTLREVDALRVVNHWNRPNSHFKYYLAGGG